MKKSNKKSARDAKLKFTGPVWPSSLFTSHYSFSPRKTGQNFELIAQHRQTFINVTTLSDFLQNQVDSKNQVDKIRKYTNNPLIPYLDLMIYYAGQAKLLRDSIAETLREGTKAGISLDSLTKNNALLSLFIDHILQVQRQAQAFIAESPLFFETKLNPGKDCFLASNRWLPQLSLDAEEKISSFEFIKHYLAKLNSLVDIAYHNCSKASVDQLTQNFDLLINANETIIHFMLYVLRLTVITEPPNERDLLNKSKTQASFITRIQETIRKIPPPSGNWAGRAIVAIFNSEAAEATENLAAELVSYVFPQADSPKFSLMILFLTVLFTTKLARSEATAFDRVIDKAIKKLQASNQHQEFLFFMLHFLLSIQLEIPYQNNIPRAISTHLCEQHSAQLSTSQRTIIIKYRDFIELSYSPQLSSTLTKIDSLQISIKGEYKEGLSRRLDMSAQQTNDEKLDEKSKLSALKHLQAISPVITIDDRKQGDYYILKGFINEFINSLHDQLDNISAQKRISAILSSTIKNLESLIDAQHQRIFSESPGLMCKLFFQFYHHAFLIFQAEKQECLLPALESKPLQLLQIPYNKLIIAREKELAAVTQARNLLADSLL